MRLILEPRGGYQPNPRQPSRPTITRHPRKPLVLEVTPDDGYFERLNNREPSKSPPPLHDFEPKSPTAVFTHKMRKKGSLFAELLRGAKNGNDEDVLTGDSDSLPLPEGEESEEESLAENGVYDWADDINQDDPTSSLSTSSSFPVSQGGPTTPTLLPNPTTTEASFTTPIGRIAKLASVLDLESSRLEISLLALGILVLVAQMGALIWMGVRRRRRSAQWHQKERQQRISEDQGQDQDQDAAENHSRFSSTARLLLKAPFLGSSSGGRGLDTVGMMPPFLKKTDIAGEGISSSWERFKARFGGCDVETKENAVADSATGNNQCLFDEVFPPPSSRTCSVGNAVDLQREPGSRYLPEPDDNPLGGGGTGYHHHNLVLGPPTVIPVSIPPAPESSSSSPTRGSLSSTASGFIETVRRKSSTILTETIMPPVHVQMEVLTEIGRRVSATLQSTVGSVIPRGSRERRGTGIENDHRNDDDNEKHSYSQSEYRGYGSAGSGDDELSSSSNEGSGSYTQPEERYRADLEAGRVPSSILNNPRSSRGDEASAMTSGATRRFSLNGSIPTGGSLDHSLRGSEGLVRRTNLHQNPRRHHNKRVSFVEGLVSPSSSSAGESSSRGRLGGNRRHSSFTFLQRGSAGSRRPGDEEMGDTVGERHEDEENQSMSFGERGGKE